MTSSRISFSGRNTPDPFTNGSKQSRPQSVHSVRVIEVGSPSSSRSGSPEIANGIPAQGPGLSRSSSLRSPPPDQVIRIKTPVSRGPAASPILRIGSSNSSRQMRSPVEPAIMEEREKVFVPPGVTESMHDANIEQVYATHEQLDRTSPENKHSKHVPFHPMQPPTSRQVRGPTSVPIEEQNSMPRPSTLPRNSSVENGTPLLAPLEEIHEDYNHDSDALTSNTPSNYSKSISEQVTHDNSSLAYAAPASTNSREQNPLRSNPSMFAKSSPPRNSARNSPQVQVEPFAKPSRPSNASNSTSSIASHKLKPVRTSEDSVPRKIEDKSKSFEQLIRSDQTIQYTLTPQSMRNIESPDSSRPIMTPTLVSNGFDHHRPGTSRSRSSSISKNLHIQATTPLEQSKLQTLNKQVQRSNSGAGMRTRPHTAQPRDPRVDRDSVNDFAEFIRSTGPVNGKVHNSPRPLNIHKGTNGTPRNASGGLPKTIEPASLPRRAESSAGRNRLQARDAVVPRGDISDLIDFVRSGPQLEKDTHRIPRTVAPFRSTMDSDQMMNAVGGKAVDASFPDRYSQTTSASVNSSVNSRSALLNNNQQRKTVANKKSHDFDDEDMMPKRKTRRVRDPYAIDFSDEDDEDVDSYHKPKQPAIKEESLADFLKNVPPPKESTVQPIYNIDQVKNVKKKSSTQSFRSRFSRKESLSNIPHKIKSSYGTDSRGLISRDAPKTPTHTPIAAQYASNPLPYESTHNRNYSAGVQTTGKVAAKSYQPRDAAYTSGGRTNDLADFLMKSDPPGQQTLPKTFEPANQKEEGGVRRMFGRKKVH